MSMASSYEATLTMADQFGLDGPQVGAVGRVVSSSYIDEERWFHVKFRNFPGQLYIVREDMVTLKKGY